MNKRVYRVWLVMITGISLMTVSAFAAVQEQEFQTLELVNVYESEEELRTTHPDLFPSQAIRDEGDAIVFSDSKTRQAVTQLRKKLPEVLREEQHNQQTFVVKKVYDYDISRHQSLVLYTEYEGQYLKSSNASERGPQAQRRIVYNRSGEVITELPLHLNTIQDSPDHNYFVAAHSGEMVADFLYFYDIQGNLLKKHAMDKYIGFKFLSDGEYVKVETSSLEKEVYLFTKTGDLLAEFNYRTLFHDNLFDFHVSDNAQLLLFSMFNSAYLISQDGSILWQKPYLRIIDCRFNTEKNSLLFYAPIDKGTLIESRKAVFVVSLINGELLDSIEDVELLQLTSNGFLIKKEGIPYEYSIR